MPREDQDTLSRPRDTKLREAIRILQDLGFGSRQTNEVGGYTLLALIDLKPTQTWANASDPLRGITPIIDFVSREYGVRYAPNTRETIRDEAVKHFVESGMLIRNPDDPKRPTNSGRTVYQVEPLALSMFRSFGSDQWKAKLDIYMASREEIRRELKRARLLARVPVKLQSGEDLTLSPGGQNPLVKNVLEEFCPRFLRSGIVVYIGDTENKLIYLNSEYLKKMGVEIPSSAKMPDVVVHDTQRNWLLLIEAVTSAGPVDSKRRKELKDLFKGANAGLVFVTAFPDRDIMRSFLNQISWETEVWVADDADHLIHFNGERFLGPYPDAQPQPHP